MKCEYCGSEIPENASFCPSCGMKVTASSVYQNGSIYDDETEVPKRDLSALAPIIGVALALLLCAIVFFAFLKPKLIDKLDLGSSGSSSTEESEDAGASAEETTSSEGENSTSKKDSVKTMYINTEDGLLLRSGPGQENDVMYLLSYGQEIKVEKIENGWAYTTVDGHSGWCSADYLSEKKPELKPAESASESNTQTDKLVQPSNNAEQGYHGYVFAEDGVNMRYGPGTQYDIIETLPFNAEAIERGWEDGWIYIEYNGKYGWVSSEFFGMRGGREKPVIYLYPTETMDVHVKVDLKTGAFTETIPFSVNGEWDVTAEPSGLLTDKASGRKYPYIFWESSDDTEYDWSDGYVVAGYEAEDFLSGILPKMGLNEKESSEFIEYWLPRLEKNSFNLITFQTKCYTDSAGLEVYPEPDSILRVFMAFKKIPGPVKIAKPSINSFERKGFTVVEWGGAEVR